MQKKKKNNKQNKRKLKKYKIIHEFKNRLRYKILQILI